MISHIKDNVFLEYLKLSLREDLEPTGDVTSNLLIPPEKSSELVVRARRQSGLMSGLGHLKLLFELIDSQIEIQELVQAGQTYAPQQELLKIKGNCLSILAGERIFLNLLQRAISIATHTNMFVQLVKGTKAKILDTRKTIPGLRSLEKQAVKDGGALNHRYNLATGILIKDNHVALVGDIRKAVEMALSKAPYLTKIEVEVDSIEQIKQIIDLPINTILMDNFTLPMLQEAMAIINKKFVTEASGGVNASTVRQIAEIGLDYISVGSLTQSPPMIDIGLDHH
jgi:nicotinate-nucleotide pyrophosphorylase (carboxylating)